MNSYQVLDFETTVYNRGEDAIGNNKASPYHPDNKVVLLGRYASIPYLKEEQRTQILDVSIIGLEDLWLPEDTLVIGHNLAFDLAYLRNTQVYKDWCRKGKIWDTQLAEFILSGQTERYPSLDSCAEKRGGTLKDDKIKEYWNAGVDTEDIPDNELREYLEGDIANTTLVFRSQLQEATDRGMLNLIRTQMDARLATIEMEINGMHVDKEAVNAGILSLTGEKVKLEQTLYNKVLPKLVNDSELIDINSNDHLSVLLFGGTVIVNTRIPMLDEDGKPVVFKSGAKKGQPRFQTKKTTLTSAGLHDNKLSTPLKKTGFYSTTDDVLAELDSSLAFIIRELRTINKDLSTYYIGYRKLIWPDSKIHPSINHCVTRTGRLSCSHPNLQNVTGD